MLPTGKRDFLKRSQPHKLSAAADPWASTLAVDADVDGNLRVWGLIDQSVHYSTFMMHEEEDGPEMPGQLHAVVRGVADIAAYKMYLFLGALTQDTLVKHQHGMLQCEPILLKLFPSIARFQSKVRRKVGTALYERRSHWDVDIGWLWIEAICRILIGIQKYGHGGALLLSSISAGLHTKYALPYRRLKDALLRAAVLTIRNPAYSDQIGNYIDKNTKQMPTGLYLDEDVTGFELKEAEEEITGCVRFLASLARVDGLIWFDQDLKLRGFGVEILRRSNPERAFLALNAHATKSRPLDLNHYGTRHRSKIRHCASNAESFGFVITQDGDIRAVTQVDGEVYSWENVSVERLVNSPLPPWLMQPHR